MLWVDTSARVYVGDILRMGIEVWGFGRGKRGVEGWVACFITSHEVSESYRGNHVVSF